MLLAKQSYLLPAMVALSLLYFACNKKEVSKTSELPESAVVVKDDLRVRISPNTMSYEIGRLKQNTSVKILQRSQEKIKIGDQEAHWYHIVTPEGLKGWVYGAYLDIEATPPSLPNNQDNYSKMKEMLIGRWYVMRQQGGLTDVFLTLYSDGTFDLGTGNKVSAKGNYQLVISGNKAKVQLSDEKAFLKDLQAELRGETLSFKAIWKDKEISFSLTEKTPKPFDAPQP